MKTLVRTLAIGLACAVTLGLQTRALADAGFNFNLGLNYVDGINEVSDGLKDIYKATGTTLEEDIVVPVGLTLNPYYEFESGLGIGGIVGPASLIAIQQVGGTVDDTDISYIIPVGAEVRYTLLRDKALSPYVKAGFRYPIVSGPNVDSSNLGFFGAAGVGFFNAKAVGFGFEIAYDTSEVTLVRPNTTATKDVKYPGVTAGLFIRF
jgi:hypothetical protein